MPDIRTTTEEFAASGSLSTPQHYITDAATEENLQSTIQFLVKKIDELVTEVNILKNE